LNELEPSMRLGGHSMGRAPEPLDDVMKAIEATHRGPREDNQA
jgi:hypothetical protein